jgi:ketosteroid isomerase-like protein
MSTEQNKAVLRRWIEALNARNVSTLDELADEIYTPGYILHDPSFPDLVPGPEGVKQFVRRVLKGSADTHLTVEDMVAEGDKVAGRYTVHHTDATAGKLVSTRIIAISRFASGKIAEEWELAVPAAQASTPSAASETHDPVAVVKAFDAACNAGDIERVMAFFADDAVLKDPVEHKVYTGKQQIREWFQPQMRHFHVESRNHQVSGDTVTWEATLTGDIVRQMGHDAIEQTAKAVVRGGKITSFALTIVGHKP